MPSKERRERAKKIAAENERMTRTFTDLAQDIPPRILNATGRVTEDQIFPDDPIYRLKRGLVEGDENGELWLNTPRISARSDEANKTRAEQQKRDAGYLKQKYPELWGKRGEPKRIAEQERISGNEISVRTVQRLAKKHP